MKICIDASNLRRGGGRTHLIEFLTHIEKTNSDLHIDVWGSNETLSLLPNRNFISKKNHKYLDKSLPYRIYFQKFCLDKIAKENQIDVLFVPGGSYSGNFKPVVTMCRNMLLFEWDELKRYFPSIFFFKLLALRIIQKRSFNNADGLIFLTKYAQDIVSKHIRKKITIAKIPHGLNDRFQMVPRQQRDINICSKENPFKILYVSTIDKYKHQENLIKAISSLRNELDWNLSLILVGSAYPPSLKTLKKEIEAQNSNVSWVDYKGSIPFDSLHNEYEKADLGVFASSCENLPNTLIEMMGAGLPIASSNFGPMKEVLKDGGEYFDPTSNESIKNAVKRLIEDPSKRDISASKAFLYAKDYNWVVTSEKTIEFLESFSKKDR